MRLTENRDFTPAMYRRLLVTLRDAGYAFLTFEEFCLTPGGKSVVLRHDVDRSPQNALNLAVIEKNLGIRGSYHFRAVGSSNDPGIIERIAGLGHEIAYHYEDMALTAAKEAGSGAGNMERLADGAIRSFRTNIDYFRRFYPVKVISMHGSPTGRIDNRLVWKYFDYRECGIICEPYFDIDFSETLYLTDTGRRWDGDRYNLRDRAIAADSMQKDGGFAGWKTRPVTGSLLRMTDEGLALRGKFNIHGTKEIMKLAESGFMPARIVINTHPQRWNDNLIPWLNELCLQGIKNRLKRLVIIFRGGRTIK